MEETSGEVAIINGERSIRNMELLECLVLAEELSNMSRINIPYRFMEKIKEGGDIDYELRNLFSSNFQALGVLEQYEQTLVRLKQCIMGLLITTRINDRKKDIFE